MGIAVWPYPFDGADSVRRGLAGRVPVYEKALYR